MKLIVVGCGKIGSAILESLSDEGHDIVAIDDCPEVLTEITNVYDVMGVSGNGATYDILNEAGVSGADLLVAVTGSDEMNMLCCFIAKKMGAKNTIARIRKPEYNDRSLDFLKNNLELSVSLNPERLVAHEIYNILKFPSAVKIEKFSHSSLEMIEFKLRSDSPLDGMSLAALRGKYKARVLICSVQRGEEVFIPDGNFVLHSGDKIGITAFPAELQSFFRSLGSFQKQAKSVMILGGSKTAYYLAEKLIASGCEVKIIEKNYEVAAALCQALPKAVIINGDGAKQELLMEEGLRSVDAFVALTGSDEENILISIFASAQKVPTVISKINRDEMSAMAKRLGLDCIIAPKKAVADILVQYARALRNSEGSNVETLYRLMDDKVEALEFNVVSDKRITDMPLKDMKLKPNTLIAGIIRGRKTLIPGGNDMITAGDRVVVITCGRQLSDLSDILL